MSVQPVVEAAPERKRWLSILAKAPSREVISAWDDLAERPSYRALRAPEIGMVLVRGRAGGTGDASAKGSGAGGNASGSAGGSGSS